MKPMRTSDGERILAVFIDFENLALGFGGRRDKFSIEKVLERLVEKGKIVAKKAYADWSRFGNYASSLHAAAVELVEIPKRVQTGKNSADIRMVVDAMDLAYSKDHIESFVIVSGDSDFSPLVSKLKELGKHVIGLGLVDSTSDLLRDNCDEFIYYEDLDRVDVAPLVENQGIPDIKRKAFALLVDSLLALRRENKDVIYSSMAKDTMKRKKPSFNEEYHGYRTFSDLLEDAQRFGIIDLERHKASGMYVVTRFGGEPKTGSGVSVNVVTRPALKVADPGPRALPPAVKPVVTPKREPTAEPPRADRGRGRVEPAPSRPVVTPAAARSTPPPAEPDDRDDDRAPLGRALMDELSDDDFDDELPSYMPRKPVAAAKPTAKPAAKVAPKPPAARGKAEPKPAAKAAPEAEPEPEPDAKPARRSTREPAAKKPASGGRGRTAKTAEPKVANPAPPAPATDDDDFGAGL